MRKEPVFWDVDTQFDFMMPRGRLYVPGAETIIETVSEVRRMALDGGYSMLGDIDWHSKADAEISDSPDFKVTFAPHCMAGEPGSERVGYLGRVPIETIDMAPAPAERLRGLVDKGQFHVVIRKNCLDVFQNPNTDTLVKLVRPKRVVVFGVALDFCVLYVLKGLARHKGIDLCLLKDAVKGLGTRPDRELFDELRAWLVEITDVARLRRQLACG